MVQLGSIGPDKQSNLAHARDMIVKASKGDGGSYTKIDLIMLPVSVTNEVGQARRNTSTGDLQFSHARLCTLAQR